AIVGRPGVEDPAMAAGLEALRDHGLNACGLEELPFEDVRRRAEENDAGLSKSLDALRGRHPEVQADDLRPLGHEHREHVVVFDEALVDFRKAARWLDA